MRILDARLGSCSQEPLHQTELACNACSNGSCLLAAAAERTLPRDEEDVLNHTKRNVSPAQPLTEGNEEHRGKR